MAIFLIDCYCLLALKSRVIQKPKREKALRRTNITRPESWALRSFLPPSVSVCACASLFCWDKRQRMLFLLPGTKRCWERWEENLTNIQPIRQRARACECARARSRARLDSEGGRSRINFHPSSDTFPAGTGGHPMKNNLLCSFKNRKERFSWQHFFITVLGLRVRQWSALRGRCAGLGAEGKGHAFGGNNSQINGQWSC